MTRAMLTLSSRLSSRPVAATRFPTFAFKGNPSGTSTRATGTVRFLKKPVRQPRDLGASPPSVSVKRNSSPLVLVSRQPVMVTGGGSISVGDTTETAFATCMTSEAMKLASEPSSGTWPLGDGSRASSVATAADLADF